jgi:hypothetical protein
MNAQMNNLIKIIGSIETNEELSRVISAVKNQQRYLSMKTSSMLKIGDIVKFNSKRGQIIGTVLKINTKTIHVVSLSGTTWRVSPTLIQKA